MSTKNRTKTIEIKNYSLEEKRQIVEEYLTQSVSQSFIMQKYNLKGHSSVLNWIRQFGLASLYELKKAEIMKKPVDDRALLISENNELKRRLQDLESILNNQSPDKREIDSLKKKLKHAEMAAYAYNKMIEIAEQQLGIEIKKKSGNKQ
jgi:transposase